MTRADGRPAGIVAVALALLLPAAWALYLSGRSLVDAVNLLSGLDEAGSSDFVVVKAVLGVLSGLLMAALGFFLLAVGRGVLRMLHWAHRMTLGIAILGGSFFAVLGPLSFYSGDWVPAAVELPLAAFFGWTIWYLNQPSVAERFASAPPATAPPAPPSNTEES